MNNVLFFVEEKWALGQIHYGLSKRLWEHNIYSQLWPWNVPITEDERNYLLDKYDTFVTLPNAAPGLVSCGIPAEKIVIVAHHEKDVHECFALYGNNVSRFKNYGVIHEHMAEISANLGIARQPVVVRNGVDFDHYYAPISKSLQVMGYAGAVASSMTDGTDFKRGYLLQRVLENSGLSFKSRGFLYFLAMPGYYKAVDALLVTSKYEGCGLPALEAAAAGKLVLAANAGYFDGSFGVLCRTSDDEFVFDAKRAIEIHKDPKIYKETCERTQQYARDHLDWKHTIAEWIRLFTE